MKKKFKKTPLSYSKEAYSSFVYYGCSYKFLCPDLKKIDLFNLKLNKICTKDLSCPYEVITYSKCKKYFYVVKKNDYNKIYIMDNEFNDLSTIKLKVPIKYLKKINSIAYDYDSCIIYISIENLVYSVTLQGDFIKENLSNETLKLISSPVMLSTNNNCLRKQSIFKVIINCVAYLDGKLYIAYQKNDSLYMSAISENGNIVDTLYIDDNIYVNSIIIVNNKLTLLVTSENRYNYIYKFSDYFCNCCCTKKIDDKCNCHKNINNGDDNLSDVIQSIAYIECALANILNAESEKIMKSIKIAKNCDDLIIVNESVSKTINNITILENTLIEKLSKSVNHKKQI